MKRSDVSPTAPPEGAPARVEESPPPRVVPSTPRWTGRRIASLVIGALLALVSLGLLGSGGTASWAYLTQRDAGYVTTDVHEFSTAGSALATQRTDLASGGVGWLYAPRMLGDVRIRATPVGPAPPLFLGIGSADDVDRYLTDVKRTVI